MLGYVSAIDNKVVNNRFGKIHYLIGDYDVTVYRSELFSGWVKAGSGSASFKLIDNFIIEKVKLTNNNSIIRMNNTIGCDIEKDSFKLFALDIGLGKMDVFNGKTDDGILTFCSVLHSLDNENENGELENFKLIFKQLSELENELVVGCSKDNGKTWFPFLKNKYKRK